MTKATRKMTKGYVGVFSMSRLGNQMFEIAAGATIAKRTNREFVGACIIDEPPNEYRRSTIFKNVKYNSKAWFRHNEFKIYGETMNDYLRSDYSINHEGNKFVYTGYFQDIKYIDKDVALSLFSPSEDIIKSIEAVYPDIHERVAIHVRRGDYLLKAVQKAGFRPITAESIFEMIEEYFPDDKFIIVSDDIEWCKTQFTDSRFIFQDRYDMEDPTVFDLYLMTQTKGNIISCSTFSWWGAFLNQNNNVVAPYPWFIGGKWGDFTQIYPKDWVLYNTETKEEVKL